MSMAERPQGLNAYIAVTAAYWAFMLSDGALHEGPIGLSGVA